MAITEKQSASLAAAALRLAADDIDARAGLRPNVGMSLIRMAGALHGSPAADGIYDANALAQAPRDALKVLAGHLGLDASRGTLSAINAWTRVTARREITAALCDAADEHEQQAGGAR